MFKALAEISLWTGLGAGAVTLCVVAAYFLAPLRRVFIEAAIVVAVATFVYAKGVKDGAVFEAAKWNNADVKAVGVEKAARDAAERDVDRNPGGVRNDPFARDGNNP